MPKILVVEDSNFMSAVYRSRLEETGYELEFTTDVAKALDKLKTSIPDVVILDILLPAENGYKLLQEMRGNERLKNIPVLVVTTLSKDEGYAQAMESGASEYLVKSEMSTNDLLDKIRALLKKNPK